MSINNYIESLTKIDKTKSVDNVAWAKVVQEKSKSKPSSFRGKGIIPYQLELEKANQSTSRKNDQKYSSQKKANFYETYQDSRAKYGNHRFAEIIPSVREVGGGFNTFSNHAIEMRIKENKLKYSSTEESDLSTTCTTATSKSAEDSFNPTREILDSLKLSNDEASSSENKRYKKNALMARLLNAQINKSSDIDTLTDMSSDWDNDASDEQMYEERISRFVQSTARLVQSTEDEDVYVHPLKEGIRNDPEWQKFQLQRKGIQIVQTPRQFYLELEDDDFNFETIESA